MKEIQLNLNTKKTPDKNLKNMFITLIPKGKTNYFINNNS